MHIALNSIAEVAAGLLWGNAAAALALVTNGTAPGLVDFLNCEDSSLLEGSMSCRGRFLPSSVPT
ncbi:hypothetical protein AWC02_10345 [Mycolicibacter engbaekii]|uniref:Uncharacterized protein n=1 Tax=Mycolicibacter engbaekii TaxID=188915 RepID=A0A1X1TR94_9MYCO|nr:hypothetical protein [Mycolicibacter engbaekii]ORV47080.1 hypothetical protein AWC02_10345 [Mycolicibacter engbaekii]